MNVSAASSKTAKATVQTVAMGRAKLAVNMTRAYSTGKVAPSRPPRARSTTAYAKTTRCVNSSRSRRAVSSTTARRRRCQMRYPRESANDSPTVHSTTSSTRSLSA
jgi:hypothetical protein